MKRITLVLSVLLWAVLGCSAAGAQDSLQNALEYNRTNQASTWVNPDTGGSGSVAPVSTFENAQGLPCREFRQTIVIGGREEQGYGTACRQPDGNWHIVSGKPDVTAASPPVERRTTVYVREAPLPYYYPYYPYYPYGYYPPRGYAYPYGYPFSFSFGYVYRDGGHGGGHHGGGHGGHHGGGHGGHHGGGGHGGGGHGGGGHGGGGHGGGGHGGGGHH